MYFLPKKVHKMCHFFKGIALRRNVRSARAAFRLGSWVVIVATEGPPLDAAGTLLRYNVSVLKRTNVREKHAQRQCSKGTLSFQKEPILGPILLSAPGIYFRSFF